MKLRSCSSERDLIEADDVVVVYMVAGGVEVEVEDGGVHHLLHCRGIDVGEEEVRIKFFDGSLVLNIFLCRRGLLICEECFESIAEVIAEAVFD